MRSRSSRFWIIVMLLMLVAVLASTGCDINSPYLDEIERKVAEDLVPDGAGPEVEIRTSTNPVSSTPIALQIVFSAVVNGFEQSDIQVENAAVTAFETTDETVFDLTLNSPADDPTTITISVAAGVATDTVGRPNQAASLELGYDTSILTVTVMCALSSPTNLTPIPFTIEFSQETTGLGVADLSITNATASNLQTTDDVTYTVDVAPLGQGDVQLVVPADATTAVATGRGNLEASLTRTYDSVAPESPIVSGASPTSNVRPTWSWTPGDGGAGSYRYKLDSDDFSDGATATDSTSYTPLSNLSVGSHTLFVRERDAAGNWSDSGSRTIVIDTAKPAAPSVSGTALTQNRTPAWTWTSAGSSNASGLFRQCVNSGAWSDETTNTEWTLSSAVADGIETDVVFSVQEKSTAGVWSESGTFTTTVDNLAPSAPTMGASGTTSTPTQDSTPTWAWTAGGGGNGTYEYSLKRGATGITSGSIGSTSWSVPSASPLGEGTYTLSVRERDDIGNWGPWGTWSIEVDFLPAGNLVIRDESSNSSASTDDWLVTLDSSGVTNATQMRFKNSGGSFSSWEAFATSRTWTLSGGDGTRTVYAEYSDAQGNDRATNDSIYCNPAWGTIGYSELGSWPMTSTSRTEYLSTGKGFVVKFKSSTTVLNYTYAKIVVNSRSGNTINITATTYALGVFPNPVVETLHVNVDWDCDPILYIDLNQQGNFSKSYFTGADISINSSNTIEVVNVGYIDLWNPPVWPVQ